MEESSSPPRSSFSRYLSTNTRPIRGDFSTNYRVLLLAAIAVVIGAISAFLAYGLLWLITLLTNLAFFQRVSLEPVEPESHQLGLWAILVPVVGALIIGLMARYGSRKIRGHGIPEALEAILLGKSIVKLKVAILKPISAAISIGTGGPFGAEGPIIMTGGACGSLLAQRFHLSAAERKTLLVAGAAAGMCAVFSAPIASVLLAVELLLFEWKPRSFIPVAVAVITASALRVPLLGEGPVFSIIAHAAPTPEILLGAVMVGVVSGFASGLLTKLVYTFEDMFQLLPIHWMWWPALGAIFIGIGGIIDPRALGVGYETIQHLLRGELTGASLAGFVFIKASIWAIALGSGTSGGVLAPLLLIGGALGVLTGQWLPVGDAGLWGLIGMAAMMGGTMRAPLTALVFAVEITHDFQTFPVILVGVVSSLCVTVLLMRRSILTERLARKGHHITREYSIDQFEISRVRDVMDRDIPCVPASMKLAELARLINDKDNVLSHRQGTLIVDEKNRLTGIITRGDMVRTLSREDAESLTVADAGTTDLIVAYPDELLVDTLNKMLDRDIGRLPVVSPEDTTHVVGYIGRSAILSARKRFLDEEHQRETVQGLKRARS